MKYFTTKLFNKYFYVLIVNEIISRANKEAWDNIRKIYSNKLKVDEKLIILACKINNKIEYIYGSEIIINELKQNKNLEIVWEQIN